MSKADEYRTKLRALDNWDSYLLKESGLPGPRGNLELAQVVADEGDLQLFRRYTAYTADEAPVNSPYEFLAFCGIVGLGRLLAEGDTDMLTTLQSYASDPRWRIREAVAMARTVRPFSLRFRGQARQMLCFINRQAPALAQGVCSTPILSAK